MKIVNPEEVHLRQQNELYFAPPKTKHKIVKYYLTLYFSLFVVILGAGFCMLLYACFALLHPCPPVLVN